ncbi:LexA family transcriptional regulator [Pseudaminobacter sp. NGMCC 1.201702]|uniref:LexA family transcriptional regulator n=1 Tax=Pseudaminobacter sp. NGMCC 1.201702 TaxID=3391825 RepID=UPI0039EEE3B8
MDRNQVARWLQTHMARKEVTQADLGDAIGLSQDKISKIIRGKRDLSAGEAAEIAKYLGVPMPGENFTLDVIGYIGAGAEVRPINDGEPLQQIEVDFPVPQGSVAAIVRGDSMFPIFEDGDLVAYGGEPLAPEKAIGSTCVVQLSDGRMLIKRVRRGTQEGLYTLTSSNAPDIEDVPLDWARAFILRLSRDYWRKV